MDSREKLISGLKHDIDEWYRHGKRNNLGDIACTVVVVCASLAASILGGDDDAAPVLIAAVAAVPAAAATLQRAVNFRGRSNWYFTAGARLRALLFEVEHAKKPDLEDFARRRGELELELEKEWGPAVGGAKAS
jgi:hypothetical protein